jgi:hypothetical protein
MFPSAAEARQRLFQAVERNDGEAVVNILREQSELASASDEGEDKVDRQLFVQKFEEMHRLGPESGGSVTLYFGGENWPLPIPLVEKDGAWRFDADAGLQEVLFRRIGENEVSAIATCHEFVTAKKHYRVEPNLANVEDSSPTSLVAKAATDSAGGDRVLLHGYYFHVLATAGRFALIAYPAKYRSSGAMTFIVTGKDVVYETDLGAMTRRGRIRTTIEYVRRIGMRSRCSTGCPAWQPSFCRHRSGGRTGSEQRRCRLGALLEAGGGEGQGRPAALRCVNCDHSSHGRAAVPPRPVVAAGCERWHNYI